MSKTKGWFLALALAVIAMLSAVSIGGVFADDNNLNTGLQVIAWVTGAAAVGVFTYQIFRDL